MQGVDLLYAHFGKNLILLITLKTHQRNEKRHNSKISFREIAPSRRPSRDKWGRSCRHTAGQVLLLLQKLIKMQRWGETPFTIWTGMFDLQLLFYRSCNYSFEIRQNRHICFVFHALYQYFNFYPIKTHLSIPPKFVPLISRLKVLCGVSVNCTIYLTYSRENATDGAGSR